MSDTGLVPTTLLEPGALEVASNPYARFTEEWLKNRRLAENTQLAYRQDVTDWLAWCERHALEPLAARFTDVNAYARALEATVNPRTGRAFTPSTVARKLSAVSSWYRFLVKLGAVPANPALDADRPRVDRRYSSTIGLSRQEAAAFLEAADADGGPSALRTRALLRLLVDLGIRVSEACSADMTDLGYASGHRFLLVHGKGGKDQRRSLPPAVIDALDAYLEDRAHREGVAVGDLTGLVFVTSSGEPLRRGDVFRLVRRIARAAGIPSWAGLSPHSLRHAWNTVAREQGVPLETRQDAMGHVDPRTTRRYDRTVMSLDQDPSYIVAAALAAGRK